MSSLSPSNSADDRSDSQPCPPLPVADGEVRIFVSPRSGERLYMHTTPGQASILDHDFTVLTVGRSVPEHLSEYPPYMIESAVEIEALFEDAITASEAVRAALIRRDGPLAARSEQPERRVKRRTPAPRVKREVSTRPPAKSILIKPTPVSDGQQLFAKLFPDAAELEMTDDADTFFATHALASLHLAQEALAHANAARDALYVARHKARSAIKQTLVFEDGRRFTADELESVLKPVHDRIASLTILIAALHLLDASPRARNT